MKTVFVSVLALLAVQLFAGVPVRAQATDEEMAWVTDQDDEFFYLAYTVPESDHFAISFVCNLKDQKTFVVLHENEGQDVKPGDKFPMTLQIGDAKTIIQAETVFDDNENILRTTAPIKPDDEIFLALNGVKPLEVTRANKTQSFPLTEVTDRLQEFQQGCGLKK
jgi:hypothetical protein